LMTRRDDGWAARLIVPEDIPSPSATSNISVAGLGTYHIFRILIATNYQACGR
jgi:hypothetical protein